MKLSLLFFLLSALSGLASSVFPRLAVFALLLLVIAWAALTRFHSEKKKWLSLLLFLGTCSSFFGMYRFVLGDAMPGILGARAQASQVRAVSLLREILFAQDVFRRHAPIDPDGDAIGSAGLLGELTGQIPLRSGRTLAHLPLSPRYAPQTLTKQGPVYEEDGYLFLVCLPLTDGNFGAHPGSAFDDERAEREFVAYAWPSQSGLPHSAAYFIDANENILESPNWEGSQLRLVGPLSPPSCDDAWADDSKQHYAPWKGKKPRAHLPGIPGPSSTN